MSRTGPAEPLACVIGDMDLVRPLGLAGIPCAVVAPRGSPATYSRFTRTALYWTDFSDRAESLIDLLERFAAAQPVPPILYYGDDAQLLLVSRYRQRLAGSFRFVVPDLALVEDLVDKGRFQLLAERLGLPTPSTRRLDLSARSGPADLDLKFPIVIKPVTRRDPWKVIGGWKALQVDTPEALREWWPRLVALDMGLLAQELIPGPETRVESYHVYVDSEGNVAGEFTGRKLRTCPPSHGYSTALVTTDATDVRGEGRSIIDKLGLRGVAKLDFKRDPEGKLHLLEVNPRFNLWHHLGAVAGVNLPELVYADTVGLPRPALQRARAGVHWSRLWEDLPAARACGMPMAKWLPWALRCEAKSVIAFDDPMPLLRGSISRWFLKRTAPGRSAPRGATDSAVGR